MQENGPQGGPGKMRLAQSQQSQLLLTVPIRVLGKSLPGCDSVFPCIKEIVAYEKHLMFSRCWTNI